MVPEYLDIVKSIRENVALPVIVSTYSTNGEAVAEMLNETNAESISLYNLQKMDIMEIKQHCREANIDVDLFESSMPLRRSNSIRMDLFHVLHSTIRPVKCSWSLI